MYRALSLDVLLSRPPQRAFTLLSACRYSGRAGDISPSDGEKNQQIQSEPKETSRPIQFSWRPPQGPSTPLRMYNSLTHQIEPLRHSTEGNTGPMLSWYACGPTVYDHSHLGHARCYMAQDIIMRILRDFHVDALYVMGVTDVDDKIIHKARALTSHDGPGTPIQRVARPFESSFWEDMDALGVERPHAITRVSEHMENIVSMVQKLLHTGYAYEATDGSVYFDTTRYRQDVAEHPIPTRSRLSLDDLVEGTESLPHKKHVADFALWKASGDDSASLRALGAEWELRTPRGTTIAGRPGWHIECSAMCEKMFGQQLDVHAGGIDLLFPHHCNEVAQSQAFFAHPDDPHPQWPHYFLHVGHVYIQGAKMSKSLKNFITIKDFLQEGHSPNDLRWFCLQNHYRAHVEFGPDRVENARSTHQKVTHLWEECAYRRQAHPGAFYWNEAPGQDRHLFGQYQHTRHAIRCALADDFDTPTAVQSLLSLVKSAHVRFADTQGGPVPVTLLHHLSSFVHSTLHTWGVQLKREGVQATSSDPSGEKDSTEPQAGATLDRVVDCRLRVRQIALDQEHVDDPEARAAAMKKKLLILSDDIRDGLLEEGVEIKDRQLEASTWRIMSTEERERAQEGSLFARKQQEHQKTLQQAPPPSPEALLQEWRESGHYAAFDEEGLPTHDADGSEISKSRRKKFTKQWEKQKRQYQHYLTLRSSSHKKE